MSGSIRSNVVNPRAAVDSLRKAAGAKKCWSCGCLHSSLKTIREVLAGQSSSNELAAAVTDCENHLTAVKYDCLGCEECYPADAVNALGIEGNACPAGDVEKREGWPPLPGRYTALRYQAPVAVCTLASDDVYAQIRDQAGCEVSIVGTLQTENLGIERLIENIVANPNIRFLIVCGSDSRQSIGHLPGQSMVSLAHSGLDERDRILGAKGKRPIIRNLAPAAVDHFRRTVEVVDRIGEADVHALLALCSSTGDRNPGPAGAFESNRVVTTVHGYLPERMVTDPSGYSVIYSDHVRGLLFMEHYSCDGVLDLVIEGKTASEVYVPAIERNLVSRLDHAAYLGRELARAEECLKTGRRYVQDAAPERCGGPCVEGACFSPSVERVRSRVKGGHG